MWTFNVFFLHIRCDYWILCHCFIRTKWNMMENLFRLNFCICANKKSHKHLWMHFPRCSVGCSNLTQIANMWHIFHHCNELWWSLFRVSEKKNRTKKKITEHKFDDSFSFVLLFFCSFSCAFLCRLPRKMILVNSCHRSHYCNYNISNDMILEEHMFQGENKNKMKTKNSSSCPFCKVNTAQVLMLVSFWPNEVVAHFQNSSHFTSNYHNTVNYTDPN